MNPETSSLFRKLAGLILGWLACVSLVAAAEGLMLQSPVPLPSEWISVGSVFLAAMVGGYLAAFLSRDRLIPRILLAFVLFTGLAYGASSVGSHPLLLAIFGALGVYVGSWMRHG